MNLQNYITQDIPDRETSLGSVKQKVVITSIKIDWQSITMPDIHGLPQLIVGYELVTTKEDGSVVTELKDKIEPKHFDNTIQVYQRSFEKDTLFQPLHNLDYVEGEGSEDDKFLTMGAFDFVIGELALKRPQFLIPFLKLYIIENFNDGWYDSPR